MIRMRLWGCKTSAEIEISNVGGLGLPENTIHRETREYHE